MDRLIRALVVVLALAGLGLGATALWLKQGVSPVSPDPAPVGFEVRPGESLGMVANALEAKGLIRSAMALRIVARASGRGRNLRAGLYHLDASRDAETILGILESPEEAQGRITVPEGFDIHRIAALLEHKGLGRAREFEAAARLNPRYRQRFPWLAALPPDATLEGFLFPDTYRIGSSRFPAEDLVEMMLARFGKVGWPLVAAGSGRLNAFELVTLASIVEREAKLAEERPLIAGVFVRRLQIGMPLGSDPTVEYALGRRQDATHNLTLADIRIDSPYNTYRFKGLPPGPIANPGLASLRAALTPSQTDYLYFVARGDGSHTFSRTYHEQRVAQRLLQHH